MKRRKRITAEQFWSTPSPDGTNLSRLIWGILTIIASAFAIAMIFS